MSRWSERWLPVLLGLLAGVACWAALREGHKAPEAIGELFSGAMAFGAISAGFLATTKSILFSIPDSRRLKELQKLRLMEHLISCLMSSIRWSLGLAVLSALGVLMQHSEFLRWLLVAWAVALVTSVVSYNVVASMLASLLRSRFRPLEDE